MSKIKIEDLSKIKERVLKQNQEFRLQFNVCGGTGCHSTGSKKVISALREEIGKRGLDKEVKVIETGCNGFCAKGPVIRVLPEGIFYQFVKEEDVLEIIEEHVLKGIVLERLLYEDSITGKRIPLQADIPFFAHQEPIALRNRGVVDPENIEDYIAEDGYAALGKALTEMKPEDIISEMKMSGLRGRGGAGFPTGLKWEFCSRAKGSPKYVLCNGDEGDPGAFMDRSILEADPHAVLEGMIIAARAIGAQHGYIYCRAEYPLAVHRLNIAIEQAREYGLLGDDIFGLGFGFDLEIYEGAGAFVCGEETALMLSIEGKRGNPRPRPPFPAQKGLWDKPSNLNNVETYANVPTIIRRGAKWYSSLGTENSKGTKVFAMTGSVMNVGLVEVPMGVSISDIVFKTGGGMQEGKRLKAVQLGGPSGGCLPVPLMNTPVDYDSIARTGAIVGSGGMVVIDDTNCMVDIAKFFLGFTAEESCGKCTPCRVGTKVLLDKLTDITEGRGKPGDIELLEELSSNIIYSALCGLGKTAPNPVLTTIRYFREEYEAHIYEKRCAAEVCKRLMPTPCQKSCPLGQDAAGYIGLIALGRFRDALEVIRADNPLPSICGRLCIHGCEANCRRGIDVDEPISIRALKRFVADHEIDYLKKSAAPAPVIHEERVAIIGSGPAGLAAAYDLVRMGYRVTIFEALPFAGGLLRTAIPGYRLPRKLLDAEIKAIEALGVEIKTSTPVRGEQGIERLLQEGCKAIFIATGASKSRTKKLPGEEGLKGVVDFMEFLKQANSDQQKKAGDRVIVIGTGHAAMDAARLSCRLGSAEVHVLSQRLRSDMQFDEEEISQAEQEGVNFLFQLIPREVIGKDGKVSGLKCVRTLLSEPDARGRHRPIPLDDEEVVLEADALIHTQGREPDTSFIDDKDRIELSGRNLIVVDQESLQTTKEGVFAGGEVVSGPATVVESMALGRGAARSIDRYLRGERPLHAGFRPRPKVESEQVELTDEEAEGLKRAVMPMRSLKKGALDFDEVETGLTTGMAVLEAKRCLRCDL
jgi:NADH-quinone oxidoreductase subunit F